MFRPRQWDAWLTKDGFAPCGSEAGSSWIVVKSKITSLGGKDDLASDPNEPFFSPAGSLLRRRLGYRFIWRCTCISRGFSRRYSVSSQRLFSRPSKRVLAFRFLRKSFEIFSRPATVRSCVSWTANRDKSSFKNRPALQSAHFGTSAKSGSAQAPSRPSEKS